LIVFDKFIMPIVNLLRKLCVSEFQLRRGEFFSEFTIP
jgi:hypothetical protein